jgi:hypothetical protein
MHLFFNLAMETIARLTFLQVGLSTPRTSHHV